jgi:quercetin dioxygenase-like cupin family protein
MTHARTIALTLAVLTISLTGSRLSSQSAPAADEGFIGVNPEDLEWRERGEAKQAIIAGDPAKPGMYVLRLTFPPGYSNRPHSHSQDRYVTVIKGTWWVAIGPGSDVYDPSRMVPMKAGSFVKHPAGGIHYDAARDEEVIVQIMGMGPVTTTQVTR